MILAPINPPQWDSDDANTVKEFLSTKTGVRLQDVIAFNCPALLEEGDVNKILIASGKHLGYEEGLSFLRSLMTFQPEQPKQVVRDNYPDLDNEALWPKEPDLTKKES